MVSKVRILLIGIDFAFPIFHCCVFLLINMYTCILVCMRVKHGAKRALLHVAVDRLITYKLSFSAISLDILIRCMAWLKIHAAMIE